MKKFLVLAGVLFAFVTFTYGQFTFTSIDYPGAVKTSAPGINNYGEIAGSYRMNGGFNLAYIFKGGQFLPLDLGATSSLAGKINNRGDVVGQYLGNDGLWHGYVYCRGVLTTLDYPGAIGTTNPYAINDFGVVAGLYGVQDSDGNLVGYHGFIWDKGKFIKVGFPDSVAGGHVADTGIFGINNRGEFVGFWDSVFNQTPFHGFVYAKGKFHTLDVPYQGTLGTQADDINDTGNIVGAYADADGIFHGFLALRNHHEDDDKDGDKDRKRIFIKLDYPGAAQTAAWAINSFNQIVGSHNDTCDANGCSPIRGFLAKPLE